MEYKERIKIEDDISIALRNLIKMFLKLGHIGTNSTIELNGKKYYISFGIEELSKKPKR